MAVENSVLDRFTRLKCEQVERAAFHAGAEKALGHGDQDHAATTDISNSARDGGKYEDDGGERMKALVWMGKNDVRVVETPKPKIIDAHDVIVKVTSSTVCGSDVHLVHCVVVQTQKGDILGHEFCGVIDSVGPAVTCRYCEEKLTTACEKTNALNLHTKMYRSRMAEFLRAPLAENNLLKLLDSVPGGKVTKPLPLLSDTPTSYYAVDYTGVQKGDVVAIWGLGPIGFMACYWAKERGAKRVIGIDNKWRIEYAKEKTPGVEPINYEQLQRDETVPKKIHQMVPGGVDVSIDATGGEYGNGFLHKIELATGIEEDTSEMINEAIYSTMKFGKVGVIGDYVGCCGQAPKELLQMIKKGKADPTIMAHKMQEKRVLWLVQCFVETRFSGKRAERTPELTKS
ncbi:chaperonin 10-like protein [Immersiella caudata]|uniref:Chaperonin 10-like protein n=1 Tax=Immersiella caudata TaxID=314043 RepID=A0AA40BZ72_9PEZI|nr:chaperonin 10-like protein [Immersiella caudata]